MSIIIIVFLSAILSLFGGIFAGAKLSRYSSILGLSLALVVSFFPETEFFSQYKSMYLYSSDAAMFSKIALVISLLLLCISGIALNSQKSIQPEIFALMQFSLCGALLLFGFQNMVVLFLGIEILSIPLYVLAGSNKSDLRSNEASMKYFLMGAFATGFLLFGIALVYGFSISFDLNTISNLLSLNQNSQQSMTMMIIGMLLIIIAMSFKVALVPFHMWSPDVYQGSPSLVTAFMASVVKIAGFVAFFKLMEVFTGTLSHYWINILAGISILSLLLPNFMALAQSNAKRMLAYSSVSHAGYISILFFGLTDYSSYYLALYLFAYSLATLGAFTVLIWVEKTKKETSFEAFNGLAKSEKLLALLMTVSVLSMAGVPLTAGFIAKFSLFDHVFLSSSLLVFIAIIGSGISIAYYLKIIKAMYFNEENQTTEARTSLPYRLVGIVILVLIIGIGIYPDGFDLLFHIK